MANISFDIVSEVDLQEMDNAVNQANKELSQRYDFKDSKASIAYDRKEKKITLIADNDFKLRALTDILQPAWQREGFPLRRLNLMFRKRLLRGICGRQLISVWVLIRRRQRSSQVLLKGSD